MEAEGVVGGKRLQQQRAVALSGQRLSGPHPVKAGKRTGVDRGAASQGSTGRTDAGHCGHYTVVGGRGMRRGESQVSSTQ